MISIIKRWFVRRTGGSRYPLLTLTALVLALAATWGAQSQERSFSGVMQVEVVNIDVVVTGRGGEPVSGLTREDFQLLVDGEPVELSNFFEVTGYAVAAQKQQSSGDAQEPAPEPLQPEMPQISVVVLIDSADLQKEIYESALSAVRGFLEPLAETGSHISLISIDQGVHVKTDLDDDPAASLAALDQLISEGPAKGVLNQEWKRIYRDLEHGAHGGDVGFDMMQYYQHVFSLNVVKIRYIADYIAALAELPGRKALLFVSDGIVAWQRGSMRIKLERLTDLANAAGVTFHTVNAGGFSREELGHRTAELARSRNIRSFAIGMANSTEYSMQLLAERTGGLAVAAKPAALAKVARDLGSYYSLGFVPDDAGIEGWQKLEVTLRDPSLKVRHRPTFRQMSRDEIMVADSLAPLFQDSNDNPLQASLEVVEQAAKDGRHFLVPVTLHIPTEGLVFLPEDESWRASVIVQVTAKNDRGIIVEPFEDTLPLTIPNDAYEAGSVPEIVYDAQLRLRKGEQAVAVTVHDELSGQQSSVALDVIIDEDGKVSTTLS